MREIIEGALLPLKITMAEIKASVAKELEQERLLVRKQIATVENEIMNQLSTIRTGMNQQLELLRASQIRVPDQCGQSNTQQTKTVAQEDHQIDGAARVHQTPGMGSKTETRKDVTSDTAETTTDQDETQATDLSVDLLWFKEQVKSLQEEHRQYRQELRRQQQQQLLQQTVAVSKSELQDELKKTKEETLSSVKAQCILMEVEIDNSLKILHAETKDAMKNMLSENNEEVTGKIIDMLANSLPAEQPQGQAVRPAAERGEQGQGQGGQLEISSFKQALDELQALMMGQSQRVIDKIRNPSSENKYVFHLYIPHFENYIGSGKSVYSLPCAIDFEYSFMILRGVARFAARGDMMTVALEQTVNVCELGLAQGKKSAFVVKCRVKTQATTSNPDILIDEILWEVDPSAANCRHFIDLGNPIDCRRELVRAEYNTFQRNSVLIEFEITDSQGQGSFLSRLSW